MIAYTPQSPCGAFLDESSKGQIFERMFVSSCLFFAQDFLAEESRVLAEQLDRLRHIRTLVIIGSGPLAYRKLAMVRELCYIGVDPHVNVETDFPRQINKSVEEITRFDLGSEPCLIVFWFNVLHYVNHFPFNLARLVKSRDAVFHSTWGSTYDGVAAMGRYYSSVYGADTRNYHQSMRSMLRYPPRLPHLLGGTRRVHLSRLNCIEMLDF